MMTTTRLSCLVCLLLLGFSTRSYSQDANYWSHQYGAYSTLLGGTVIGSVSDLAATYYNPGRLIMSDTSTFLISAKAYQLATLRVENATGDGRDVTNSRIAGAPDLVAGNLPWRNFIRKSRMAYSVVQRYGNRFDIVARGGGDSDALPNVEGVEFFAGELGFETQLSDFWAGITWSTLFGDKIGFGVTQYFSIRSYTWNRRILYEALREDQSTATAIQFQDLKYNMYSALWKFGLSTEIGRGNIGLSLTTPYLNLFGKGNVLYNEVITGGDLTGDGKSDDLLAANQQLKLKSKFRTGWIVGLGGSFPISSKGRIHLSAEYFSAVKSFDLLKAEPFTGQSDEITRTHDVYTRAKSVINYGVGIELEGGKKTDFYGSITTDTSPIPDDPSESVSARLGIDLIHVSGGTVLTLGRVDLNLGLVYSFGNSEVPQFSTLYFPPGWSVNEDDSTGKMSLTRLKLIFGVTVN